MMQSINYLQDLPIEIITPTYNRRSYLEQLAETIVAQTDHNWRWLVADDGSTDSTWSFLADQSSRDSRIRPLLTVRNSGAASARNLALGKVESGLITFVDSDDLLAPDHLENLRRALVSTESDVAVSPFQTFSGETPVQVVSAAAEQISPGCYADSDIGVKAMRLEFPFDPYAVNSFVGKLFAPRLRPLLRFPPGLHHEDVYLAHTVFTEASRVVRCTCSTYFVRYHPNSTMRRSISLSWLHSLRAYAMRAQFFQRCGMVELRSVAEACGFRAAELVMRRYLRSWPGADRRIAAYVRRRVLPWSKTYRHLSQIHGQPWKRTWLFVHLAARLP